MSQHFDVPIILRSARLREAVQRMRSSDSRSILVDGGGGSFYLLSNRDIAQAKARGLKHLAELEAAGSATVEVGAGAVRRHRRFGVHPPRSPGRLPPGDRGRRRSRDPVTRRRGGVLRGARPAADFVLVEDTGTRARILSRGAPDAAMIFLAGKVCACSRDCGFSCDCPPGVDGQPCPDCLTGRLECI